MKSMNLFFLIVAVSLLSFVSYGQEAYAPWANLRQDMPDGDAISYENMKLNTPDKNMVELPAYPGAKIVATSQETASVDETQKPKFATITLISDKPAEKIIGFYKDLITEYPGWHWDNKIKIFYKDNLQDAISGRAPYIQVTLIQSDEPDLKYVTSNALANASSKIVVCYNPAGIAAS
jgi:hypothetical protein